MTKGHQNPGLQFFSSFDSNIDVTYFMTPVVNAMFTVGLVCVMTTTCRFDRVHVEKFHCNLQGRFEVAYNNNI